MRMARGAGRGGVEGVWSWSNTCWLLGLPRITSATVLIHYNRINKKNTYNVHTYIGMYVCTHLCTLMHMLHTYGVLTVQKRESQCTSKSAIFIIYQ